MAALLARTRFIAYIRAVMPWFTIEQVHCLMADYIERVAARNIDRLMFSMGPRGSKSSMSSIALPSWWMGKFPNDKIMALAYKADLSSRFSRQTLGIIRSRQWRTLFPGVRLAKDAYAVGYWNVEETTQQYDAILRGEYQAAGVTSGIAGSGFNLGIVDDPLSEQDKDSKLAKDRVWEWWGPGFYTRRQPEHNAIVVIMTRWAIDDLAGRLQDASRSGGDKWEVVNVPAILDGDWAKRIHSVSKQYGFGEIIEMKGVEEGGSFAPARIPMKELLRSKSNMTARDWNALYMGNPSEEEGVILKRAHWHLWPHRDDPDFIMTFSMYDTAFGIEETNDFSAMTRWGIFEYQDRDGRPAHNLMLVGRWKKRIDAPDLPKVVDAFYQGTEKIEDLKEREIVKELCNTKLNRHTNLRAEVEGAREDRIMIENKASGIWLIKEMRRRRNPRLPVWPWNPPKGIHNGKLSQAGNQIGKYARAQLAALVLEQGVVWYVDRKWAEDVIDECAKCKFDGSDESDDLPDTVTAALIYVRQTWMIELESDINEEQEAEDEATSKPKKRFYGSGG
jgi:hypothetical protein